MTEKLFVSCLPGLELVLGQEIEKLGYSFIASKAGVFVPFVDLKQVYKLNLELRTASRVLLPLHSFTCRDKRDLYNGAMKIDWKRYFTNMPTFAIDAVVHHEALTNSLFAAQVVKDAICDQLKKACGERPNVDIKNPDVQLHLFIFGGNASISFDSSGVPLHARGYRLEAGIAPLRETVAAALLLLSGYKGDEFVVDPCCGSATILIEAALIASKCAPGLFRRRFGIFSHPEFQQKEWDAVREIVSQKRCALERGHFLGIEQNPRVLETAKKAVKLLHFENEIQLILGDFRKVRLPFSPTFVIANPPYGVRLETTDDLRVLYKDLGDFLKLKTKKPARGAIFTGNLELAKCIGLRTSKRHVLSNGGIDCRLLEYDLYDASTFVL